MPPYSLSLTTWMHTLSAPGTLDFSGTGSLTLDLVKANTVTLQSPTVSASP